jgi:hypothetical protein
MSDGNVKESTWREWKKKSCCTMPFLARHLEMSPSIVAH